MSMSNKTIKGFSKLNKKRKIEWIAENFHEDPDSIIELLASFWHPDESQQKILDGFSENTISNFAMPYCIAPNFIINKKAYTIPMVIEESSVVAAASAAAKFWMKRGGFRATVINTLKVGQIHLTCDQDENEIRKFFEENKHKFKSSCKELLKNMESRGGGIKNIGLVIFKEENEYFQIRMAFETCDSMGANFINSVLECYAKEFIDTHIKVYGEKSRLQIIMCILSNYTPECLVRSEVCCPIEELGEVADLTALQFAYKFKKAVRIAEIDPYRATTHNKGIYNGIDAVVLATGNDFRAIEACGHTYACRDGHYRSLSHCTIEEGIFKFWLEIPMALGTVGGLTNLHPLARISLEILENPSSRELMMITASVGLAQNFAALKSLISTGIQKGHMKMHLSNVLHQLKATEQEFMLAMDHFRDKIISHKAVRDFLNKLRIDPSKGSVD